ncbi:hypothetical protein Scep_001339 [Stephania cephalantha]|uniref:Uncharacterized protein n=1 Tax=Stephania cephalantha TaxID=152367 RepID=A0AAP0Q3V2_9MAGN
MADQVEGVRLGLLPIEIVAALVLNTEKERGTVIVAGTLQEKEGAELTKEGAEVGRTITMPVVPRQKGIIIVEGAMENVTPKKRVESYVVGKGKQVDVAQEIEEWALVSEAHVMENMSKESSSRTNSA